MRQLFALTIFSISILAACGGSGSGDDNGDDAPACMPDGVTTCMGNTFETCSAGDWDVTSQCNALCDDDLGCIACVPDQSYCDGDMVMQCATDGSHGTVTDTCSGGEHCLGGECVDLCQDAADTKSYIGCEYYAVDLDNAIEVGVEYDNDPIFPLGCALNAFPTEVHETLPVCYKASATDPVHGLCDQGPTGDGCTEAGFTCQNKDVCVLDALHSPFAIVVSNPQSFAVHVTLSTATGTPQMVTVAAGQVSTLFPQMMSFPDQSVDRGVKAKLAYKLVADAPIVAYQFNPLNNVDVFSNDASLLIPSTTWDTDYYVMSFPSEDRRNPPVQTPPIVPQHDYNGFLTVVAGADGTTVEVTPSADTRPNGGSFAAITAGTATNFTLDAYEVLNLEAVGNGDLTGSRVRSLDAKTIGVFSGTEASGIVQSPAPNPSFMNGPCCADHLEEMMFPTSTWGKVFALARSKQRNGEADNLRIIAQTDNTMVHFTPAATAVTGDCTDIDAGKFCEVKISADTEISSDQPILVGQYLESVIWGNGSLFNPMSIGNGDPSMALAVPTEQFRSDYTILVPSQYTENYISVSTSDSGTVNIDGNDDTGMLTTFASSYKGGRIAVTAGQHKIHCSDGCGIEVMGYSDAVSYLFAGGLDLNIIVVN